MKKGIIITSIVLIIFLLSIGIGFYSVKIKNKDNKQEEPLIVTQEEISSTNEVLEANTEKIKITPNTKLVLKKFYTKCNHTINSYVELPKEFVNMDEDEIKKQFPNWKIDKFTKDEVVILKEENAFCNEHYVLKEQDGKIAIFKVNQKGEEILKEITNISIDYLPEQDLLNIKNGIKIYSTEQLNKTLEDYE